MSFEIVDGQYIISATAVMTTALAAILLLIGYFVKSKVNFLNKYCIPAPVVGGFLFMFVTFAGHMSGSFGFKFDTAWQSPFMLAFFTCVGLGASFDLLKKGGILLIVYWLCAGVISIVQNAVGIAVGQAVGLDSSYALLSSAISMIGGHGAAGAYGKTFAEMGHTAAVEVGAAAATFGLISGVLLGGPLARKLIVSNGLKPDEADNFTSDATSVNKSSGEKLTGLDVIKNVTAILVCMAIGTEVSKWIGKLIAMDFPTYVGAMFIAVIWRNLNEKCKFYRFDYPTVEGIGDVMLALYLSIALMTLKLWDLLGLMGGVLAVVLAQVIVMAIFAYFILFRILGKNYDAAVMCAGMCGHALGATPTAIVNMTAVKDEFGMSRRAFMIVPIVGAFLVDIIYQPQTVAFIKYFVTAITK